jgi:hypothetical protein
LTNNLREEDWNLLLKRIELGKCTPFIGAGACFGVLPLGADIAKKWAAEHDYPLDDSHDLARVAQYFAVKTDPMAPKEAICELLRGLPPPAMAMLDEPHNVLAGLPLPVYITTNYDDFMAGALRKARKDPTQELCRWNKDLKNEFSVFEAENVFEPSSANPVVFHLHGLTRLPQSLVLTEDDYLDFLVNLSRDDNLIPPRIRRSLTDASLLFVGYRIADWDFRVLFRGLVTYLTKSISRSHVSVQIAPNGRAGSDAQQGRVQEYLDKYYGELKIKVYWGTCHDFTAELRKRWEDFNRAK